MKKYSRWLLAFVSWLLTFSCGILFAPLGLSGTGWLIALGVMALLPIFLYVANLICGRAYMNRLERAKVAEMQSFLLSHRERAEQTAKEKGRTLRTLRRLTAMYTLLIWLCAASAAALSSILGAKASFLVPIAFLYCLLLFYTVYSRIRREKPMTFDEYTLYLEPDAYPALYAVARRAADAEGCREQIAMILSLDCNARIIRDKGRYVLQLGIVLLHVLSEDELYHVLLHEFHHVSDAKRDRMREARYDTHIHTMEERYFPTVYFLNHLFLMLDFLYSFHHMLYSYATSIIDELEADRAMMRGEADVAVSALLKLQYDNMYFWESATKNEKTDYFDPEPSGNYLGERIERFKRAIAERSADWNAMVALEILPNNATHPTLRMRMEALGVTELKTLDAARSEPYDQELAAALAYAEELVLKERKRTYEKDRKELYVDPVTRVNEWWEQDMPLSAERYADVISDLKLIGLHEEAEKLCDRAIAELGENESVHAYFMKGCALLYRYDPEGMRYLYHAIEKNKNYLEEGLTVMGTFCCYTGRERELQEYRAFAAKQTQKDKDEDSRANFLSKHDRLSAEHLPDGMLEDILGYIRSVDQDIIQRIFLVRKTVSESFFTSAFIIHFYGGTDEMRNEIMHKIFRYLDSYPTEWQFSLFDYFEYPDVKVEKIEGSLVYTKNK